MSESIGLTGQVHEYGNLGRHGKFGGPLHKIRTIRLNDIGHGFGPWHVVLGCMFTLMAERISIWWGMSDLFGLRGLVDIYCNSGRHGMFGGPLRKIRTIRPKDIGHGFGPWHVVSGGIFTLTGQRIYFWWWMSESIGWTDQVHKYGNLGQHGTFGGPLGKIRTIRSKDIGHLFGSWQVVSGCMFTLTAQLIYSWWGMSESFGLTGLVDIYCNLGRHGVWRAFT